MPEALKDKVKSEAIKEGLQKVEQVARATFTNVKAQETKPPIPKLSQTPVECSAPNCSLGTNWPTHLKNGTALCPRCLEQAWNKGEITQDDLLGEGEAPQVQIPPEKKPEAEAKEYKPKEKPEFRRAVMQPMVSKMDTAVLEELHKRGHKVEFQKEVCLQKTVVDFIVDGAPFYLDGRRVHQNREWKDDKIRERLATIFQRNVHAITYERYTESGAPEIVDSIEAKLT